MQKPAKTLADYLVLAISPGLIMVLVGSLAFFLIQVFYRGEGIQGVRWLMFWFVLAIVLVSRISIEQGKGHGWFYGVALALVTWFYLAHNYGTVVLGAILLGITWWCAHRLTVDCTLIREDEDASGEGVLPGLWRQFQKSLVLPVSESKKGPPTALELMAAADLAARRSRAASRPPGRWVVYFSLAALPLFGIGQLFLPEDDPHARRLGFGFLVLYLGAALSLLETTSFLGLRRYLRQRSVEMPASITFGWIKFGALLAGGVLLAALILPRPERNRNRQDLEYRIEQKEREASDHALPFNRPGEGEGAPANQPSERNRPGSQSRTASTGGGTRNARNDSRTSANSSTQPDQPAQSDGGNAGSGNRGSSGREGQSPDNTPASAENRSPSRQNVTLKDAAPSGGADQSREGDQPGGSGGSGGGGGDGAGRQATGSDSSQNRSRRADDSQPRQARERPTAASEERPADQPDQERPENREPVPKPPSNFLYHLLRVLVILALAALFIWFLVRFRKTIADMIRAFCVAVRDFFRKLFSFRWRMAAAAAEDVPPPAPVLEAFATYENPFLTGKDKTWPPERLLLYTYEAVQAWAKEQGIEIRPEQTPREFCFQLIERFPDFGPELEQFSFYYAHAAFARRLPDDFETESIRRLWQSLGDSVAVVA